MGIVLRAGSAALLAACLTGAAYAKPTADKDAGSKVICRTIEETGSRLSTKRVCLTRDEWRQQKEAQRQDLERSQRARIDKDGG